MLHGGDGQASHQHRAGAKAAQALQDAAAAKQQALHLQRAASEMKAAQLGMREVWPCLKHSTAQRGTPQYSTVQCTTAGRWEVAPCWWEGRRACIMSRSLLGASAALGLQCRYNTKHHRGALGGCALPHSWLVDLRLQCGCWLRT